MPEQFDNPSLPKKQDFGEILKFKIVKWFVTSSSNILAESHVTCWSTLALFAFEISKKQAK